MVKTNMVSQDPLSQKIPCWICQFTGILSGWVTFLFILLIVFIGISSVLSKLGMNVGIGSGSFWIGLALAGTIGCLGGIYIGRKFSRWICNKNVAVAYLCLTLLVIFAILSFPAPFGFVMQGN